MSELETGLQGFLDSPYDSKEQTGISCTRCQGFTEINGLRGATAVLEIVPGDEVRRLPDPFACKVIRFYLLFSLYFVSPPRIKMTQNIMGNLMVNIAPVL